MLCIYIYIYTYLHDETVVCNVFILFVYEILVNKVSIGFMNRIKVFFILFYFKTTFLIFTPFTIRFCINMYIYTRVSDQDILENQELCVSFMRWGNHDDYVWIFASTVYLGRNFKFLWWMAGMCVLLILLVCKILFWTGDSYIVLILRLLFWNDLLCYIKVLLHCSSCIAF